VAGHPHHIGNPERLAVERDGQGSAHVMRPQSFSAVELAR
jgi:hypothetical protein